MNEPHSSTTTDIIKEVHDNIFTDTISSTFPPQQQPAMPTTLDTTPISLDLKGLINNLKAETKRAMTTTSHASPNKKMEDPHSSSNPETMMEVMSNRLSTP